MAQREPTAAQALYSHLPSAAREPSTQRAPNSLANSLYPSLSREAKARDEFRKRDRDALLEALRSVNGRGRR